MDTTAFLIIIAIVAAVSVVIAIGSARMARERRMELARWAGSRGWHFDPETYRLSAEYAQFDVFSRGHSQRSYNTIRGEVSIGGRAFQVRCGDYSYKVTRRHGKGSSTHTYEFSYLLLRLPFDGVPNLEVRREGLFDKFAQAIGFEDIDFESEEFSRAYCVKSSSKKFAFDVVTPRMMEFLLRGNSAGVAVVNGWMCLTDGQQEWMASQFDESLRFAEEFFGLWPEFVYQDLAVSRGMTSG
jgi:hypothetical protein